MSVRSNADMEVGLTLYTDWQLKTRTRALAGHASKNNRQEERAPCLTRGTRFSDSRTIGSRSVLPVDQRHALKIKAGWTRARYAVRTYATRRTRAKGRVRVPLHAPG